VGAGSLAAAASPIRPRTSNFKIISLSICAGSKDRHQIFICMLCLIKWLCLM
jgi:hypothetical protein